MTDSNMTPLQERLVTELNRYGLPVPRTDNEQVWKNALETLLQHIYANHNLTLALNDKSIELLEKRVTELTKKETEHG